MSFRALAAAAGLAAAAVPSPHAAAGAANGTQLEEQQAGPYHQEPMAACHRLIAAAAVDQQVLLMPSLFDLGQTHQHCNHRLAEQTLATRTEPRLNLLAAPLALGSDFVMGQQQGQQRDEVEEGILAVPASL